MNQLLHVAIYLAIEGNNFTARVEMWERLPAFLLTRLIVRGHVNTMLSHIKSHIITWALKRQRRLGSDILIYCSDQDRSVFEDRVKAALTMTPPPSGLAFYFDAKLRPPRTQRQRWIVDDTRWEARKQAREEAERQAM